MGPSQASPLSVSSSPRGRLRFTPGRAAPLLAAALLATLASGAQGSPPASLPEIVFASTRSDGDLVVIRADGMHRRVLTPSVRDDRAPSWSPEGRLIAFSHPDGARSLIEVLDLRTGRLRQLGQGRHPDWSSDGKRLVFVDSVKPADLATMNADGTDRRLLDATRFGVTVGTKPAWAPDGSRIAFVGSKGLYTIRPDGSDARQLRPEGRYGGAAWSPDSKRLVFDCGTERFALCAVRADGSGFRGLTKRGHTPSWSPRGDLIAIASYNRTAIVLIRPSGKLVRNLPGSLDDEPDWSPDGKRLVVSQDVGPGSRLYATDPSGSRLARLTHGYLTDDTAAAWSPDGHWVAFRRQQYAHCSLEVLDVRTRRLRELARGGIGEHCRDRPDWSTDGKRILYAMRGRLWLTMRIGGRPRRIRGAGGAASSPRWTPDGRSIAFVSPRGIWVLGRSGRRRLLVPGGGPFAWSHDGKTLAYEARESPTEPPALFVREGSAPARRLVQYAYGPPSWSPRGDRIAFLLADANLNGWSLAVTDLAGNAREIFGGDPSSPDWRS